MTADWKWIVGTSIAFVVGVVGGGTLWKGGWRVLRLVTEEDLKLRDRYYTREEGEALEKRLDELKVWVHDEGIGPLRDLGRALVDLTSAVADLKAQSKYMTTGFEEMRSDVRAMRQEQRRQ